MSGRTPDQENREGNGGRGAHLGRVFIGIAGIIGAGKTTLATALGQHLGLDVHYEPVIDNEYLDDFYRETKRYSFAMQVYLLNRRFQQHQEIIWRGRGGVQDRTIYEDAIFAKTLRDMDLMDPRDYETYVNLFRNLSNFMCRPNFIIYLDVAPEKSLERIRERSRGCETGITVEYLTPPLQRLRGVPAARSAASSRCCGCAGTSSGRSSALAEAITREYTRGNFLREVAQLA